MTIEMTREISATVMPKLSELRNAKVSCQNMSWPRELVPNQYCQFGGMSGGTR